MFFGTVAACVSMAVGIGAGAFIGAVLMFVAPVARAAAVGFCAFILCFYELLGF